MTYNEKKAIHWSSSTPSSHLTECDIFPIISAEYLLVLVSNFLNNILYCCCFEMTQFHLLASDYGKMKIKLSYNMAHPTPHHTHIHIHSFPSLLPLWRHYPQLLVNSTWPCSIQWLHVLSCTIFFVFPGISHCLYCLLNFLCSYN